MKKDPNAAALLFAVHSYYALFMKFLAAEIATMFNPLSASFLARLHQTGSAERLREELRELEDGGIYRHLGIKNFLEGDLFSWYLDAWDDNVEKIIRQMVAVLDEYDPKTLSIDPIESRDLLKKLYQQLFPKTVRHDLGEYYTPDWLAELVIERVGYDGDPDKRVLDPACGSGTFLVMAINKVREYADEKMIPKHELLPKILDNIVGFDLNPLAVMAARTNYLLALRELLKLGGEIEIPVYLCDSIITPTEYGGLITEAGASVGALGKVRELKTSAARFMIPTEVAKTRHIVTNYAAELEHCLRNGYTEDEFLSRARGERIPLVSEELHRNLYRQIGNLRKQNKNDIWARIIKNSFAPLFTERVDYVVGNPPWIGWENLPSEYRKDSASIWEKYGLIPDTPKGNWFRVAKLDLAALFVYVCLDSYLSEHGKLGFVITQSVYKNINAGKKFRRCLLPGNVPFRVLAIDDMVALDPFEDASNRTTTMIFQKNLEPRSDIPYCVWRKSQPGPFWSLDYKDVLNQSERTAGRAYPENPNDISSPWVTPSGDVVDHALAKLRQPSAYRAREGTNTRGANAIFWIKILENARDSSLVENFIGRAKSVPKNIKPRTIENNFLYPLLRSSDVLGKWQTRTELGIIVPQNPEKPIEGFPESEMKRHYPKTYEYLNAFKSYLSSRKPPSDPFYTLYDVGSYTFAPWKVVWLRPAKRLDAAVVGMRSGKAIIPQETITLVALDDENEAHYVCALINSSIGNLKAIQSGHAGTKSFGSPEVLERLSIPKFERNNALHARLAAFSQQSHRAVVEGDDKTILQIETGIDEAAAEVWGITSKELVQIQKTLKKG